MAGDEKPKNRAQRRQEAKEARRLQARENQARAGPSSRPRVTPPEEDTVEMLSFTNLRLDYATPGECINAGFIIQEAMATHGQEGYDKSPYYTAKIKEMHDCLDLLESRGGTPHIMPPERQTLIEETYKCLLAIPVRKFLTISFIYTYRHELAKCSYRDVIMVLGPVKADWFGRAMQMLEGDPTCLAEKDLKLPRCGGCGCHLDRPRKVAPRGVPDDGNWGKEDDEESDGESPNGTEELKAKQGDGDVDPHEEERLWLMLRLGEEEYM